MKASLTNYEIDLTVKERKVVFVKEKLLAEVVDIVKSVSCLFTTAENIDFSGVNPKDVPQDTKISINERGNVIIAIAVKAYLPDSHDFVGPRNFLENVKTNDNYEDVVSYVFLEYVGEIDPPVVGPLAHFDNLTSIIKSPNKPDISIKSEVPGVTLLVRTFTETDDGNFKHSNITFLVKDALGKGSSYWLGWISSYNQHTLGYAKDAKVYATLIFGIKDHKPEKLN